ncbi:hypothetical protein LTR36_009758 [Oleoguttula mirabilis]|uniref:PH domain-containing protein n=1 Tax=Oleoguttula mirabilis TaxID=1507867 RepID=A0AAV9J5E0_9PEZI|nr:hypothetical protein LTR36_009758 [Oleoguttula mirabilis]
MAGIEQIVVHSKSYVVRWIQVPEHQSIAWSVEPHKKSINFGIFKHPGTKGGLTPTLPTQETVDVPPTPALDVIPQAVKRGRQGSVGRNETSTAREKLESVGLKSVAWTGKCEADKVTMGRYDVPEGEGGTYGLVFDNTFSKQTGKTVHFVLLTHPTDTPVKSGHHMHYSQAFAAGSTTTVGGKGYSPSLQPITDSNENLPQTGSGSVHRAVLEDPRPASKGGSGVETTYPEGSSFYTGVLHKKRRKKGQGHAKRFFSLDFTSSTLSYYRDRHSSALRGAVPLSLAAVGANDKTREFSIDSGAEVWHLKALNRKDFEGWQHALERASSSANAPSTPATPALRAFGSLSKPTAPNPAEDREWQRVEQLVSKVSGTRDAVRGLAKDTDPKYLPGVNGAGLGLTTSGSSSNAPSPSSYESAGGNPYFPDMAADAAQEKRAAFWKRKPSAERSPAAFLMRSVSAQLAVPSPSSLPPPLSPAPANVSIPKRPVGVPARQPAGLLHGEDVHERCMALLRDLNDAVTEFSALVAESKARRHPALPTSGSRMSLESVDDQEFFDAREEERGGESSPRQLLLRIRQSEDEDEDDEVGKREQLFDPEAAGPDSDTSSDVGDADAAAEASLFATTPANTTTPNALFPSRPTSLAPLPLPPVKRRLTVRPPKQAPPSIIGFLRKNAGKDLSTVSMPVTANEPTSLLQRLAESLEYPQLLDLAASTTTTSTSTSSSSAALSAPERLMYVAAFAISYFANNRVKERAVRKPFNPMLGETYELVREDLGVRFVAEKVSHHPVRMACQAEGGLLNAGIGKGMGAAGWTFTQSPRPVQKFWGKSVEVNMEGRVRVVLHGVGGGDGSGGSGGVGTPEHYSWSQATCFLRNVIAGEKYVEPVQSMTIACETSGMRAVATFKAGGMFSGRSEEVAVQLLDASGQTLPLGLEGKWTEGLRRTDTGVAIWTVGSVVPADAAGKGYGFTAFAAALNEITGIEEGHLPGTDSRLRPDQAALEAGEVDEAEGLKARLEERQRGRRRVLEGRGKEFVPRWFERVGRGNLGGGGEEGQEEEVWVLKSGEAEGYWGRRARGDWGGGAEVFEL